MGTVSLLHGAAGLRGAAQRLGAEALGSLPQLPVGAAVGWHLPGLLARITCGLPRRLGLPHSMEDASHGEPRRVGHEEATWLF